MTTPQVNRVVAGCRYALACSIACECMLQVKLCSLTHVQLHDVDCLARDDRATHGTMFLPYLSVDCDVAFVSAPNILQSLPALTLSIKGFCHLFLARAWLPLWSDTF